MASPQFHDTSHPESRRVRMDDGFAGEDLPLETRAVLEASHSADGDDTSDTSASSAVSSENAGEASDDSDSEDQGHASSRSRRSSASRWSRRSSPPPALPASPLLPSRRQSSNTAPLTHEERMTLGMRRSSSRASRTSRTSRVSRASGGGVVSFEDDQGDLSGDESDHEDEERKSGDGDDVDVDPLTLQDRLDEGDGDEPGPRPRTADRTTSGPHVDRNEAALPSSIAIAPLALPADIATDITETSRLLPDLVASPVSPTTNGAGSIGDEAADADTLFEQSLMAGAWSAFRRTEGGRGAATGARERLAEEQDMPNLRDAVIEAASSATVAEMTPGIQAGQGAPYRREITYCEPVASPAATLQQDLYNLFLHPKYLTLRCGASAPQRVFTRGCASTLTLFGVSLTLPNAPSHMAAWRTLIPVPMIWHKPAGTQTQWFATKEVPETVVKLLVSPYGDDGYDMRRVGMREPGGGRDCYVLACSCCGNKLGFYFNNPPEAFKGYHWLFLPSLVTALKEEGPDDNGNLRKIRPSTRSRQRTDPMEFLMPLDPKDACPDWVKTENRRHMHTPRMAPRSWDPSSQADAEAGPSTGLNPRAWPRISYNPRRDTSGDQEEVSTRRGRSGFVGEATTARPRIGTIDTTQAMVEFTATAEAFARRLREAEASRVASDAAVQATTGQRSFTLDSPTQLMLASRAGAEGLRPTARPSRARVAGSPLAHQTRIAATTETDATDSATQPNRRATGVGNGVEMRQVLIDGRMMDVVVIGESDSQTSPTATPSGTSGAVAAAEAAIDCPPDVTVNSRGWLANFNATRADLLRSANAWQAIRDAENDADARIDEEDEEESDDDWQTRVGDDGLEAVSERSGEDDTHGEEESEVSEEGTESGEEVNDDGGIPMRGWSMLDVDGQRARSRSRSRSRSRADSPARGRESFSRNTQLRGSLRHPSTSRSRSRVRMASPSPTPSANFLRRAEESDREEARINTWRYWKQLAVEWQTADLPLVPVVEGRAAISDPVTASRTQREGVTSVIDPELLVY